MWYVGIHLQVSIKPLVPCQIMCRPFSAGNTHALSLQKLDAFALLGRTAGQAMHLGQLDLNQIQSRCCLIGLGGFGQGEVTA